MAEAAANRRSPRARDRHVATRAAEPSLPRAPSPTARFARRTPRRSGFQPVLEHVHADAKESYQSTLARPPPDSRLPQSPARFPPPPAPRVRTRSSAAPARETAPWASPTSFASPGRQPGRRQLGDALETLLRRGGKIISGTRHAVQVQLDGIKDRAQSNASTPRRAGISSRHFIPLAARLLPKNSIRAML